MVDVAGNWLLMLHFDCLFIHLHHIAQMNWSFISFRHTEQVFYLFLMFIWNLFNKVPYDESLYLHTSVLLIYAHPWFILLLYAQVTVEV